MNLTILTCKNHSYYYSTYSLNICINILYRRSIKIDNIVIDFIQFFRRKPKIHGHLKLSLKKKKINIYKNKINYFHKY